jgi:NAD(P)-dependent dehydrogenase (short-subunit alcohol dehydrogenase family)
VTPRESPPWTAPGRFAPGRPRGRARRRRAGLLTGDGNSGISGLVKTLAVELAPHRVNALHPGIVGDSPKWRDVPNHPHVQRTPTGRLVTMEEVADATDFLLANSGVNAVDLFLDGGLRVT